MEAADRPPMRSFKPRRRRLGGRAAHDYGAGAPWRLAPTGEPLDLEAVFGRVAPVVLEIGFGGGEALVELAEAQPERDVIGVEVHVPGIARVLGEIGRRRLTNVRVVEGDATEFLDRLPPASLSEVRIFFPDPWPKVRQQKRRIVRPEIVARLVDRLAEGGALHLATDWPDYATQMQAVAEAEPRLAGGPVGRPAWRPPTRFEQRGRAEGREPRDFAYRRVAGAGSLEPNPPPPSGFRQDP